jgi:hypothetical protein
MDVLEEPSLALEPVGLEAPPNAAETRPYDVRACGVQVLEALAERARVPSPVASSVHEIPTREITVSFVAKDGLAACDEFAVSLMAKDGLTVHDTPTRQYAVPQDLRTKGDDLTSTEVVLGSGRGIQQTSAVHVVPRSLTTVSAAHGGVGSEVTGPAPAPARGRN